MTVDTQLSSGTEGTNEGGANEGKTGEQGVGHILRICPTYHMELQENLR